MNETVSEAGHGEDGLPAPRYRRRLGDMLLILCGCDDAAPLGLDPERMHAELKEQFPNLQAVVSEEALRTSGVAEKYIQSAGAQKVVSGVCAHEKHGFLREAALRAGIKPYNIETVSVYIGYPPGLTQEEARDRTYLSLTQAIEYLSTAEEVPENNLAHQLPSLSTSVSRRGMFTSLFRTHERIVPSIDHQKCIHRFGCDLCIDSCPTDALKHNDRTPVLEAEACISCSLCERICPPVAIELPRLGRADIIKRVRIVLNSRAHHGAARSILFHCSESTEKVNRLLAEGLVHPPDVFLLELSSHQSLDSTLIMASLVLGADKVGMLRCHCPSHSQKDEPGESFEQARELLTLLGMSKKRAQMVERSSDPTMMSALLERFAEPSQDLATRPPPAPAVDLPSSRILPQVVKVLAERLGVTEGRLIHEGMPAGTVTVDPGTCILSDTWESACGTGALTMVKEEGRVRLVFDPSLCIACGVCAAANKEEDVQLEHLVDVEALLAPPVTLAEDTLALCSKCHEAIGPSRLLTSILKRTGLEKTPAARMMTELCPRCRTKVFL